MKYVIVGVLFCNLIGIILINFYSYHVRNIRYDDVFIVGQEYYHSTDTECINITSDIDINISYEIIISYILVMMVLTPFIIANIKIF